ncbi:TPA: exodeoxyribonuclease VII large subunit [Candidatus Woesearchaeota archaeon]|nr:exodeoxyribonuclease VII large subunit [Candidatus Woesearchaeota archaeon]
MAFKLFRKKRKNILPNVSVALSASEADSNLIDKRIFSVYEITRHIKNILKGDKELEDFYLRGEISTPKQYPSGHTYFTLKDEKSQISCVLFRRNAENIRFNLEHGMKVIIRGRIDVYEPRGDYSVIVEDIQPDGIGALNLAFIQLKNKLEKQGLFLNEHKKQLPQFPKTIGLISSLSGAVMHDVLNVLKRRYPLVKVLIVPTPVQGKEATNSIVDAITLINQREYNIDVIILARGGGSLEDLWCFNEESVARAIFQSRVPLISAIGHETDFTIADFVADYRAPTPSVAAEKATPDINELKKLINNFNERILNAIDNLIKINKSGLDQMASRPIFRRPLETIHAYYQKIDSFEYMLKAKISQSMSLKRKSLEISDSKLSALNPRAILERGYSIVMKGDKIIKSATEVKIDNNINVIFYKGELEAEVKKIKK